MNDIAVKFENVSKYYKLYDSPRDRLKEALHPFGKKLHREFYALKNIDLEVKKGEILGIVGRNGSGKSTLLKIISGVIRPNAGQVTVNGEISSLLELGSGLNPDFDGIQNISFGGIMMGFTREEMNKKVDDIAAFAEIGEFIHQPMKTYSSGMKARLGFALAVNIKPDILVVDEVLSVGDDLFKRKCYAKMEELFKTGCTVFFVSHSASSVNEICTRAILLDQGELILEGSPKLVTMNYLKLLYANPGEVENTRDDLCRLNRDEEKKKEFAAELDIKADQPAAFEKTAQTLVKPGYTSRQTPYYINDFKPKSTVVIKNDDVNIYDMKIKTLEGEEVNALVTNEEYIYSYKVKFGVSIDNVSFGMGFKNEKGMALSWMIYPGIDRYIEKIFHKGETYCVDWRFKCLFTPGNFYIDSGVRTPKNSEMTILVKITDAVAFKIIDTNDKQKGGIFDSICDVEIKKI